MLAKRESKDRGAKGKRRLTGDGKRPRQGTQEAISMDRQKAKTKDAPPHKSHLSFSVRISCPQRMTEAARTITSLGKSAPTLHSKASSFSLPTLGAARPNTRQGLHHACQGPHSACPASILLLLPQILLPFSKLAV